MRIWDSSLIPKLCRQHLLAMWREGIGCYKIITENKKGYRHHPAVKEFEHCPNLLLLRLMGVRYEMEKRGYHPKVSLIVVADSYLFEEMDRYQPWQTLDQQIQILRLKKCECQT